MNTSDWFCPTCQFKIFASKDTCKKCGMSRTDALRQNIQNHNPSLLPNLLPVDKKYKESIQQVSEQVFDLKEKLTDNEFKTILDGLQTCYQVAPADETVLQTVQNGVYPMRTAEIRAGDWICPGCNFRLFASKTECKKCKIKRP